MRQARRSLIGIPLDWAFGMWETLSLLGGLPLGFGSFGTENATLRGTGCSITGVFGISTDPTRGSFSLGGANGTRGLLPGGPLGFTMRGTTFGPFTRGSNGAISWTGVGGRWIVTLGASSSAPLIRRSASFMILQRTS